MADIDKKGKLYGIGIGPGEPELLTIKARKLLKKVDIVFAPCSAAAVKSFAFEIVGDYVPKEKIKTIVFPMTRDKKKLKIFWEKAAQRVYRELNQGRDAAFITIGDPFTYSTYTYLLRYLRKLDDKLDICTVPGVSVVNAIACLFNIPLAEAGEKFAVIPLPARLSRLRKVLAEFDTVVILKIGKDLKKLVTFLRKEGYANSSGLSHQGQGAVYFAKRIGRPEQMAADDILQLDIDQKTLGYMSTMIIRTNKRRNK